MHRQVPGGGGGGGGGRSVAVTSSSPDGVPDAPSDGTDPQEAFFGSLLLDGRWEEFLRRVAQAAGAAVADEQRLPRCAFLALCATRPLSAARAYRTEASRLLSGGATGGVDAAEVAAVRAGVPQRHWTNAAAVSDEPLLAMSDAACEALKAAVPAAAVPAGPAAAAAASQQQQQLLLQQLGSSGVEAAAGLVDALHALHEERLLGLLAHLHAAAHAAGSDAFALETLRSAASRPESLEAFATGCEQAADALIGIGALPQSVGLAEAFHDYKTLGTLCTRQLPSLPPALLRGRHVSSPAELRHELIARLIAAPPPPPLYPHESRAKPSFVHELCLPGAHRGRRRPQVVA